VIQIQDAQPEERELEGDPLRSGDKLDVVQSSRSTLEYSYQDGESYVFMTQETFEQAPLHKTLLGEDSQCSRRTRLQGGVLRGSAIGRRVPLPVELKVVETEPSLKGATITNVYKAAKLGRGATVQVPPFIEIGE